MPDDLNAQSRTIQCARCGRLGPRLASSPYPGKVGQELMDRICADCWAEWLQTEVIVINELKLNFMDPGAQKILVRQMREFLGLDPPAAE